MIVGHATPLSLRYLLGEPPKFHGRLRVSAVIRSFVAGAWKSTLAVGYILNSTQTRGRFCLLVGITTKAMENDSEALAARRLRSGRFPQGRTRGSILGQESEQSSIRRLLQGARRVRTYRKGASGRGVAIRWT